MRLAIVARRGSQRAALVGMLTVASAVVGGCGGALFACEDANECTGAGAGARCEADGWCSVDDDGCPSGRRYGAHSGDGKAGECVEDDGTTSSGATISLTTVDPTLVTTLDSSTSSTTIDPATATLESTSASETDATSSSDGTSSGITTAGPLPVCGNEIVEAEEDCDGLPPPGTDCEDFGWASGSLSCLDCAYDTTECLGCGPDGCSFEPCTVNDPRACPAGESCTNIVAGNMCTAECMTDDHCAHPRYPTVCFFGQMVMGACFVSCADEPCPPGLTCFLVAPPICLPT